MFELSDLPTLNAILNTIAALLLIVGWFLIRNGRRRAHRATMIGALTASILFLVSYLIYHFQVGSVAFQGQGTVRTVYFAILLSHTLLAPAVPVMAAITVTRAVRGQFERHRAIARWTLPIWLYVSITGVIVYWMLYQMTF